MKLNLKFSDVKIFTIAYGNFPDRIYVLSHCFGNTLVHFLHLLLIAGRATAKEIDIARYDIAKDSGADNNIGSYWIIIS